MSPNPSLEKMKPLGDTQTRGRVSVCPREAWCWIADMLVGMVGLVDLNDADEFGLEVAIQLLAKGI